MQRRRQLIMLGAVALGLAAGVIPSEGPAQQEMPCAEETRTFCADVQPGGGRILQCLKANEGKLSQACTHRIQDLQTMVGGPLGACRDDWVANCYHPRASTSRQAVVQCLQAHQAKVSAGCQKALQGGSKKAGQPQSTTAP
jgi:hypothetical protein